MLYKSEFWMWAANTITTNFEILRNIFKWKKDITDTIQLK